VYGAVLLNQKAASFNFVIVSYLRNYADMLIYLDEFIFLAVYKHYCLNVMQFLSVGILLSGK
jgi:hypothetical protein